MVWFRTNGGKVAWLAFFALACQFALTFGHVHLGNVRSIPGALAIEADLSNGRSGAQSLPAQKVPTGLAQDFCAVCTNISLASTLVLSVTPASVRPIPFIRKLRWSLAVTEFTSRGRFHVSARGPPTLEPAT